MVALNFPYLKILEFCTVLLTVLDANLMTVSGVNKLVSKEWPKLEVINFSIFDIIQLGIVSGIKDWKLFYLLCSISHRLPNSLHVVSSKLFRKKLNNRNRSKTTHRYAVRSNKVSLFKYDIFKNRFKSNRK